MNTYKHTTETDSHLLCHEKIQETEETDYNYIFFFNPKYDIILSNKRENIEVKFINMPHDSDNVNLWNFLDNIVIDDKILKSNISNIKIPDKKYFHNTFYADFYYQKFGIELKPDTLHFNLSYDILSSTIKFYRILKRYKTNNKLERYENSINVLKYCINKYKNIYKESNDLYIIKLFNKMRKWYKELKDMNNKGKYNFTGLEKEVEPYVFQIKYSNLLNINYVPNKSINYAKNGSYLVRTYSTYTSGQIDYYNYLSNIFYKKYNKKLNVSQFSFALDTLNLICHIHNEEINNIKIFLEDYFGTYPELVNVNAEFDDNYNLLVLIKNILNVVNQKQVDNLLNTLIEKNMSFYKIESTIDYDGDWRELYEEQFKQMQFN